MNSLSNVPLIEALMWTTQCPFWTQSVIEMMPPAL